MKKSKKKERRKGKILKRNEKMADECLRWERFQREWKKRKWKKVKKWKRERRWRKVSRKK